MLPRTTAATTPGTHCQEYGTFKIHLVPSGVFYPQRDLPDRRRRVIDLSAAGRNQIATRRSLNLTATADSSRSHVIMPYHKLLDACTKS